jgi:hypothetical protein
MQYRLVADGSVTAGGSAMIMHNERLADPLDTGTQALAEKSGLRKKTLADHKEMARREFLFGLYTEPTIEWPEPKDSWDSKIVVPAWNVLRCLEEGAKRSRRGRDVLRGVSPLREVCLLQYDGPITPAELWADPNFRIRKGVGVGQKKVMRTRPLFREWALHLEVEVDVDIWDVRNLKQAWKEAGMYAGLGDMRPVYGKFAGLIEEV